MKKHPFIFALILFPIISLAEFYITRVTILDSISIGTIAALIFGVYVIYAGILIFHKVYKSWEEKSPWKAKLFLAFLSLIVFAILFTIVFSLANHGTSIFSENYSGKAQDLISFLENGIWMAVFFSVVMMPIIIIPVTLYSLYLAIKSFRLVRKNKNNYSFGITIIEWNVLVFIASYYWFISMKLPLI